ncbi:hypothetical protein GCM10007981_09290 [Thermocladium modestius]|uniref:Uncharacterized protein n=2 Tax=Thermocladium modestius TaxID=62609 RepID=A0A830GVS3_9CREN|nr:hypothetical protein GCM10007981_09290 [Thermocladium modestius]
MARYHVVIDGIEVDVLGNGWAAEVKMGSHFYDGIGQALAYRRILGIEEVWLIHVVDGDPSQHLNKLPLLIAGLGIMAAIVHRGGVEFI